jgi:hypothetical protein
MHLVNLKERNNDENDILVNIGVVSLFTKIPIGEAVDIIKSVSDTKTTILAEICLKSTHQFSW